MNVKVGQPSIALSPDKRSLFVTIPIEEGEQYTIGKLDFTGELLDQKPRLRELVKTASRRALRPLQGRPRPLRGGRLLQGPGLRLRQRHPAHQPRPRGSAPSTSPSTCSPARSFERIEIKGNRRPATRSSAASCASTRASCTAPPPSSVEAARHRARLLRDGRDHHQEGERRRPDRGGGGGEGEGHRHLPGRRRLLLRTRTSSSPGRSARTTSSGGARPSRCRSSGRRSGSSARSSSSSRTSSTRNWTFAFDLYATENLYTNFTRGALGGSMTWGYELAGLSCGRSRGLEDLRALRHLHETSRWTSTSEVCPTTVRERFRSGWTSSLRLSAAVGQARQPALPDPRLLPVGLVRPGAAVPGAEAIFGHQVNLFTRDASSSASTTGLLGAHRRACWPASSAAGTPTTRCRSPSSTTWAASTRCAATALSISPRRRWAGQHPPRDAELRGGRQQAGAS